MSMRVKTSPSVSPTWLLLGAVCLALLWTAALTGGVDRLLFCVELFACAVGVAILVRLLIRSDDWTKRSDFFSPFVAFPVGYILWFVIGSIDIVRVPSSVSFGLFDPIPSYIWGYVGLGLGAFLLGVWVVAGSGVGEESSFRYEFTWKIDRYWQVVIVLFFLTAASYLYIVSQIGIPALTRERFD
jgi:hypothetical protein